MKSKIVQTVLLLAAYSAPFLFSCTHVLDPAAAIPEWLSEIIRQIEAGPVSGSPGVITSYEYKGQLVYYMPQMCCDIPSTLWDANGYFLCSPDGGIGGSGDGRCPDFFQERTNEIIVWRDPRIRF